ncbi:hypothetical protein [Mycolicibacterium mageritense]|uniref:hypothetical protein n=1 Tax=Mycolicibacterium mageritense TaxID=53462 RepID=UPI001E4BBB2F|nr:hypothetical protein [Mycolicibacterium mageritense]GJJ24106.1 hypothetical protein MTY414_77800 [Mycolicibacterium mageritense]
MPHMCTVLEPGDETHVGIMVDGRLVEVRLWREERGDQAAPRLVMDVADGDTGNVAIRTPETAVWARE